MLLRAYKHCCLVDQYQLQHSNLPVEGAALPTSSQGVLEDYFPSFRRTWVFTMSCLLFTLLAAFHTLDMEVQAPVPASCFCFSSNSIGLGIFLMKASGTKACYNSIFDEREGIWYTRDSNLKGRIFFHVITTYIFASRRRQRLLQDLLLILWILTLKPTAGTVKVLDKPFTCPCRTQEM